MQRGTKDRPLIAWAVSQRGSQRARYDSPMDGDKIERMRLRGRADAEFLKERFGLGG